MARVPAAALLYRQAAELLAAQERWAGTRKTARQSRGSWACCRQAPGPHLRCKGDKDGWAAVCSDPVRAIVSKPALRW